jgi:hypothetical protein
MCANNNDVMYFCVGIVRGLDIQKGLLYLITPVPLQQGLIEIPITLLQVTCFPPFWQSPAAVRKQLVCAVATNLPQPEPNNLRRAGC